MSLEIVHRAAPCRNVPVTFTLDVITRILIGHALTSKISFTVGIGVRGPIAPGNYQVGRKSIDISYPGSIEIGLGTLELPKSLSTLCVVSWEDKSGKTVAKLHSQGFERHLPIYEALSAISELLLAFKLVRVGHADGRGLRTIGIGDTLIYFSSVDGVPTGNLNVGLKNYEGNNAWLTAKTSFDPHGSTDLALPHIGTGTVPIARRYVRCFELLEHGFYSEAFIFGFATFDDFVQQTLHSLLEAKGLTTATERDELLRGIKENRLKLYLGPLLKLALGQDLSTLWPASTPALNWLNSTRNRIAHAGEEADYASAARCIFACLKMLIVLKEAGAASVDIPVELFRHGKITAAWTIEAPEWIPKGELAESMDFRS